MTTLFSEHEAMGYNLISGKKVRIRTKKLTDVRNDYTWQTNPELVELDATPVLPISFPQYLLDYTSELHSPTPNRYVFAVETFGSKHIGNCVYYNIDETISQAELGIMIGNPDYWDKGYGTDAVAALVNHIFLRTTLKRIYLKTLDWNLRAQKSFAKCGFALCGCMVKNGYNFILMELHRKQWEERRTDWDPVL
jgi:RimJ/RimL family protein N-acetyltransferase